MTWTQEDSDGKGSEECDDDDCDGRSDDFLVYVRRADVEPSLPLPSSTSRSKPLAACGPWTLDMLRPTFHLSAKVAAVRLGISKNHLKRVARRLGIPRWPGRALAAVLRVQRFAAEHGHANILVRVSLAPPFEAIQWFGIVVRRVFQVYL